jgi:competence protein ComEA
MLSSGKILIQVRGDVRHPGMYEVSANELAESVIKMAIPIKPLGQYSGETATTPLLNGQVVTLATQPDGSQRIVVALMAVPERIVLGIPLDISLMSEADFDRLPGIGPALAKRIVSYRQTNGGMLRFADLTAIEGIGEKKLEMIRALVQPAEIIK